MKLRKIVIDHGGSWLTREAGKPDYFYTRKCEGGDSFEVATPPEKQAELVRIAEKVEAAVLAVWPTGQGKSPLASRFVEVRDGEIIRAGYYTYSQFGKDLLLLGGNARTAEVLARLKAEFVERNQ